MWNWKIVIISGETNAGIYGVSFIYLFVVYLTALLVSKAV